MNSSFSYGPIQTLPKPEHRDWVWAKNAPPEFWMNADGHYPRREPGVRRSTRASRHKAAYCFVDPDVLGAYEAPPAHVQSEFEDVFGSRLKDAAGRERLKLRMHPLMKRWCLYERHLDPSRGHNLWKIISIFAKPEEEGVTPSDFRGNRDLEHFTGMIGEYRLPTKKDFIILEKADRKKYGVAAVEAYYHEQEDLENGISETERIMDDMRLDFFEFYANLAIDEANQEAGSGHKMRSVADLSEQTRTDPRFYERVWKQIGDREDEGYWLRTKRSKEDWEIWLVNEAHLAEVMAYLEERKEARAAFNKYPDKTKPRHPFDGGKRGHAWSSMGMHTPADPVDQLNEMRHRRRDEDGEKRRMAQKVAALANS